MASYSLSEVAVRHLQSIIRYSVINFGVRVATNYHESLENCFELIAQNPLIGRVSERHRKDVRRLEHKSHVIFYPIVGDGVKIIAIVQKRKIAKLSFE